MSFSSGQKLTASQLNAALGVQTVGGLQRITTSSFTSGATELAWATTPSYTLAANTTFIVEAELYLVLNTAGVDQFVARIRDTNVSGTIRAAIAPYATSASGSGPYPILYSYTFTTTTSISYSACGTIFLSSGSNQGQAAIGSKITIQAIGASGVLSTA
jgi:hypothetical protein